jgi:hypothetical protein
MISQRNFLVSLGSASLGAALLPGCATLDREAGFLPLFDGKTLNGWQLLGGKGDGYGVKDGVLYCAKGGGGNLLSDREYADFIFRFEFKLEPGGNNGIALRAPLAAGSLAYLGMESQILDDTDPKYAKLKAAQYHGSIYLIAPARRGALRPVGQWNEEEIYCRGRHLRVTLNGKVIVDVNLNNVTDRETLEKHPGMLRSKGHLGFLGHNDYVEFRNLRIKELERPRRRSHQARQDVEGGTRRRAGQGRRAHGRALGRGRRDAHLRRQGPQPVHRARLRRLRDALRLEDRAEG